MKNKNCLNCKFYKIGKINVYTPDEPRACELGNNEVFENWWRENGSKTDRNTLTELECFEETRLGKFLNSTSEILDELRKLNEKKGL